MLLKKSDAEKKAFFDCQNIIRKACCWFTWLQKFTILPPPFFENICGILFSSREEKLFWWMLPTLRFLPSLEIPSPTSVLFPAAVGENQERTWLISQQQTWKQLSRERLHGIEHCQKRSTLAYCCVFCIPSSGNNKKNNNNIQGPGVAASSQNKEEVEGQVSPGAVWAMGLLPLVLSRERGEEEEGTHKHTRQTSESAAVFAFFPLSDLRKKSDAQLATSNS